MDPDKQIRIELLGGFTLSCSGSPLALPTRKAMALLAILASRPGAAFSRERLAQILWARSAPAQARGSLRQAIAQLRRTLDGAGDDVVETDIESVRLRSGIVAVDVSELECALAEGSAEAVRRAAMLYAGDFLEDFALPGTLFEQWRELEARRVRRQAAVGLVKLARALEGDSAVEALEAFAEKLRAHAAAPAGGSRDILRLVRGSGQAIH